MAPDDRQRIFDKALARHLRLHANAEKDSAHPSAEILAAYHERLLPPEQMISWKGHVAGCSRCQEILANLEATDHILIETTQDAEQAEKVLAMSEPARAQVARAAAPYAAPASPTSASARWARRLKVRPGANWRWLAPAGVLAAGLLLWVAVHETKPQQFELAKNQAPAAPSRETAKLPSPSSAEITKLPPPPTARNKEAAQEIAIPGVETRAQGQREYDALQRNEPVLLDEKRSAKKADKLAAGLGARGGSPKQPAAASPTPSSKPSAEDDERDANRADVSASVATVTAEEKGLEKQAPASSASASAASPVLKDLPTDGRNIALNQVQVQSEYSSKSKVSTIANGRQAPQQSQAVGGVSELRESGAMRMAKARAAVTVAAPGSAALWRIAAAGIIEHSLDGSAWILQASGVVTDLLAGSAPSDKVCWIVGRSGTILRTIDGGEHWQKIHAPVTADLLSVFAVDDQQASVSLAQGSYQTKDGGQTWHKLLPE